MSEENPRIYEFGPFRLDGQKRLLSKGGQVVPLTPKVFETLRVLVERGARGASKDELMREVWGETVVEETNLTTNISHLRKALGERKREHQYIVTIPGEGYRFVADVRELRGDEVETVYRERTSLTVEETVEVEESDALGGEGRGLLARGGVGGKFRRAQVMLALALGLAAVAAAAGYFHFFRARPPAPTTAPVKSIAVLPFKPLVPADGDESLEMGMADTLIARLSKLGQITVRPTGAVRRYTDPEQDAVYAGRELKVDVVLDGNIQRAGERVRVTVRAVRVADGQTLWAETFDEKFTDIFAVQDRVSAKVAEAVALKLTGREQQLLAKRHTENPEAYQAYLMGRFHWGKRTSEAVRKAIEYFDEAIRIDPAYALAYSGLADCYIVLAAYGAVPPSEAFPKAKAAAAKAMELDGTLGEAHASLGVIAEHERDWARAGEEFRLAVELSPNYATARQWYGEYLQTLGRMDEAVVELRRALEIDPRSLVINREMGEALYNARRYDEALEQLKKTLEIDPNFFPTHSQIGQVHLQRGEYEDALAAFQKARDLPGGAPSALALIGYTRAIMGENDKARAALAELKELSKQQHVPAIPLAVIHMGLGEKDQAFAILSKGCEKGGLAAAAVKASPFFDGLRSDPRYVELLQCAGLTP